MGVKAVHQKIVGIIKKYRYVILVLFFGLALMAIPSRENTSETAVKVSDEHAEEKVTVEEKLAQILSQVDGAGEVRVLLTIAVGEETLFQADEDVTIDAESSSTQISTVVITTADKNEYGLVRQTNPPVYKGAIIVCQGADDPQIQLAIVDAVSNVTGLGADRISVLKMK